MGRGEKAVRMRNLRFSTRVKKALYRHSRWYIMDEIKTKSELLALSLDEIQEHEREAWAYFRYVKKVMQFMELED